MKLMRFSSGLLLPKPKRDASMNRPGHARHLVLRVRECTGHACTSAACLHTLPRRARHACGTAVLLYSHVYLSQDSQACTGKHTQHTRGAFRLWHAECGIQNALLVKHTYSTPCWRALLHCSGPEWALEGCMVQTGDATARSSTTVMVCPRMGYSLWSANQARPAQASLLGPALSFYGGCNPSRCSTHTMVHMSARSFRDPHGYFSQAFTGHVKDFAPARAAAVPPGAASCALWWRLNGASSQAHQSHLAQAAAHSAPWRCSTCASAKMRAASSQTCQNHLA